MRIFIEDARGEEPEGFLLVGSFFNRAAHKHTDSSKQLLFATQSSHTDWNHLRAKQLLSSASTKIEIFQVKTESVPIYQFLLQ